MTTTRTIITDGTVNNYNVCIAYFAPSLIISNPQSLYPLRPRRRRASGTTPTQS